MRTLSSQLKGLKIGGLVNTKIGTYKERYSKEEREAVRKRIWQLKQVGTTNEDVAILMSREGYRTPAGGELKKHHIANQLTAMRKLDQKVNAYRKEKNSAGPVREAAVKPVTKAAPKKKKEAREEVPTMIKIILASTEDDSTKIKMISAFYGV